MATYALTLNGQPKSLSTSDPAQIAAIAAIRASENAALPDTPEAPRTAHERYRANDAAYVQYVFGLWAAANPGFTDQQLQNTWASACASYAGQNIPSPTPEEITPEARKAQLQAYAAAKRWAVEQGGVTVPGVGRIPSDDRAKLMLMGAALGMADGTSAPLVLGAVSVTLTKAQFQGLYGSIVAHVKGCFTAQASVLAAIEAGDIEDEADIDAAAWPVS